MLGIPLELVTSIRKFETKILAPNTPKTKIVRNCTTKYELPHILTCDRLNFATHEASATATWIFYDVNRWSKVTILIVLISWQVLFNLEIDVWQVFLNSGRFPTSLAGSFY